MNPLETICESLREDLSCAQTGNLNASTGHGHYFDGYAGFFNQTRKTGKVSFYINYTNFIILIKRRYKGPHL